MTREMWAKSGKALEVEKKAENNKERGDKKEKRNKKKERSKMPLCICVGVSAWHQISEETH